MSDQVVVELRDEQSSIFFSMDLVCFILIAFFLNFIQQFRVFSPIHHAVAVFISQSLREVDFELSSSKNSIFRSERISRSRCQSIRVGITQMRRSNWSFCFCSSASSAAVLSELEL